MISYPVRGVAVAVALFGVSAIRTHAVTYSVDVASPTGAGFGDMLFNPGPLVAFPGSGVPGVEVDAMSYGRLGPIVPEFYFSVAPGSLGLPGTAVNGEATAFGGFPGLGDAPADVFVTTAATIGTNTQFRDGNGIVAFPPTPGAPSPPLGLLEPSPPGDNVDALDISFGPTVLPGVGPSIFWSVNPATVAGFPPYAGFGAADILWSPAVPGYSAAPVLYAPTALLGLLLGDDLDALVYFEDGIAGPSPGDMVLFSLTPGSPTLVALAASPADILLTSPGGVPGIFLPAGALGLLPGDDLDALDVVPETSQAVLLGLAAIGLAIGRRRHWVAGRQVHPC